MCSWAGRPWTKCTAEERGSCCRITADSERPALQAGAGQCLRSPPVPCLTVCRSQLTVWCRSISSTACLMVRGHAMPCLQFYLSAAVCQLSTVLFIPAARINALADGATQALRAARVPSKSSSGENLTKGITMVHARGICKNYSLKVRGLQLAADVRVWGGSLTERWCVCL